MPYFFCWLLLLFACQAQAGEITANHLHYDKQGLLHATGNVVLTTQDFTAQAAKIVLDSHAQSSELFDAEINFAQQGTLHGDYLQRIDLQRFYGENIQYTTCPENQLAWVITAKSAAIDQEKGTFIAKGAWFELGGIPLMYAPIWQHALSRRSGLLTPSFAQGSQRGTEVTLPFYWAASPNWDMTFSPRWMQNIGTLWDTQWRHRAQSATQTIQLQYIDAQTGSRRHRIRSDIAWQIAPAWNASLHLDQVSDGLFINDYSTDNAFSLLSYVNSNAQINWRHAGHSGTLSAIYQQRLGNVSNARTLQILPRLQTRHVIPLTSTQNIDIQHQSTWFRRDVGVSGQRIALRPSWRMPWQTQGAALAGSWTVLAQYVGYQSTQFNSQSSDYTALASRLSLQTGIERISSNRQWRHEISPTIQWDISSTPNQQKQPLYDSSLAPLSMSNLLQGSRYSSWDRFERMNKVALLLRSSLQHKQGPQSSRTVLEAKVGLVWDHLRESVDTNISPNPTRSTSNLLAELAWLPLAAWQFRVGGQHDADLEQWVESHATVAWAGQQQYAQLSWQRTQASHSSEAQSLSLSAKLALSSRWSAHMTGQYDVLRDEILQATQGINYTHPCWKIMLETFQVAQLSSTRKRDTGFRFLLEFDGLGSFGDN